jgi:hypothetical protein
MVLPSMVGFFQRAHLSRMKIGGFFLPSLYAQGISFTLTTPSQIEKKKTCSCLKGPKREIFVAGIFAQIRPIWLGYLVTRPKNPKKLRLGPLLPFISRDFCFNAIGDSAKKIFFF